MQNRWLEREPTRANAWTAGLVGALLATGIVFVGTHLATALKGSPVEQAATVASPNGNETATTVAPVVPRMIGVGATLTAAIGAVGHAVGLVETATPNGEQKALGVVIASDGTVLTAAAPLVGATSVLVTLPGESAPLVGEVVGSDKLSGLAVVHVNGVRGLSTAKLADESPSTAAMVIAVTAPLGSTYAAGVVREDDVTPSKDSRSLLDSSMTDLSSSYTPLGSPVVNDDGDVVGLVTGQKGGHVVFAPSWLANPVAAELESFGSVQSGWLGIVGASETSTSPNAPVGVLVTKVIRDKPQRRAGIHAGDLIVSLNSTPIASMAALQGHLHVIRPGTSVVLGVMRNGVERTDRYRHSVVPPGADAPDAARCPWAVDPLAIAYHDNEWGVPVHDDQQHFEYLVLEGAQAGLSWMTILRRRDGYRRAFADFSPAVVAAFDAAKIERLLLDPGIIRNRAKVRSTVTNAQAFLTLQAELGSFDEYIWSYVGGVTEQPRRQALSDLPAFTDVSTALSKDLRQRGFRFVGPTVCYAHLQAAGLVNDHLLSCPRWKDLG